MLLAKLSKRDDCRIVCGACGNGLAWVATTIFGHEDIVGRIKQATLASPTDELPIYRYVLIPEGWFPDAEGVWRPSSRALRQLQRGLPAQNRRRPKSQAGFMKFRAGTEQEWGIEQHRSGFLLTVLPAEIVCIYCNMRQALDMETLSVVRFVLSMENEQAVLAETIRLGPQPRRGIYPGAFMMPYQRVRDPNTKSWTVLSQVTIFYLDYQRVRNSTILAQQRGVVDIDPSAVAESP